MTIASEQIAQPQLTIDQLTVPVGREVFKHNAEAAFYVGVIATPGVVEDPRIYQATSRFRANVYIDQKHFLDAGSRKRHGGETDADDDRSVHFSVVENRGDKPPRVVGCSRLILKDDENALLPVEHFFPEYFAENPAPSKSSEGSRLIARHEDRTAQRIVSLGLIRAMAAWSNENKYGPVHAVIERGLARMFDSMKLPTDRLTEPKWLEEYNSPNMAVSIDTQRLVKSADAQAHVDDPRVSTFFDRIDEHHGLGFFDKTLMQPLGE